MTKPTTQPQFYDSQKTTFSAGAGALDATEGKTIKRHLQTGLKAATETYVNEYSVFSYSITRDGLVRLVLGCVEVLGALEQNWKGALDLCSFKNVACFLLSSLLTCVQQVSGNQLWGFCTEVIRRIKATFRSNKCSVNEIILCHRLQELAS